MIFAELPLAEARGAMLAHGLQLGSTRLPKGTLVDAALLALAEAEGITRLWVARLEPRDVAEADAATAIAAALAGPGVVARPPVHGRVNLHAGTAGLFACTPAAITSANRMAEAVGISTLPPHTPVAEGELIATVKLIPYAIPSEQLQALTPGLAPIRVHPWRPGLRALLIQTRLQRTPPKLLAKTASVTTQRLHRLGVPLEVGPEPAHAIAPLAAALAQAQADLLLIAGATATSDRRDVIPAAIEVAGGTVARVGMPVDPGNLLVLGQLGASLVLGLPGCARSPSRNGLDLLLELWAAGLPVSADAVAGMGVGGLLEGGGRPVPWGWSG